MKNRAILFVLFLILWMGFTWSVETEHLAAGAVFSLLVSLMTGNLFTVHAGKLLQSSRYLWFTVYVPVFAWDMVRANLDMAWRLACPSLPMSPGIITVETDLKSDTALTLLANTVTLIPGMMTVDMEKEKSLLYVHCINVDPGRAEQFTRLINGRYAGLLKKIFD